MTRVKAWKVKNQECCIAASWVKLDGGQSLLELVQILNSGSILWSLVLYGYDDQEKGVLVVVHSCLHLYKLCLVSSHYYAVSTNWIEGMATEAWTILYPMVILDLSRLCSRVSHQSSPNMAVTLALGLQLCVMYLASLCWTWSQFFLGEGDPRLWRHVLPRGCYFWPWFNPF